MSDSQTAGLFSFRDDFARLHAFLSRVAELEIPLEESAFQSRYGEVADSAAAQQIRDSLRGLRELQPSTAPQTVRRLIAQDGDALQRPDPPPGLYAQTIWFVQRAGLVAGSMVSTFETLKDLTAAGVSEADRAAAVRNIFNGDRGLVASANRVAQAAEGLAAAAEAALPSVKASIQMFHTPALLREASDAVRVLQSKLGVMQTQAEQSGSGLRKLFRSGKAEAELTAETAQVTEELERKKQLSADLQTFLPGSEGALPALQGIARKARAIGHVFAQAASRFSSVVSLASDAQLSDYAWLSRAIELPSNLEKWTGIRDAARRFVQDSLVDFHA